MPQCSSAGNLVLNRRRDNDGTAEGKALSLALRSPALAWARPEKLREATQAPPPENRSSGAALSTAPGSK